MRPKVRVGAVPFLNARPLVFGIEQGLGAERIDLSYDVPSALASRMASGDLDLALLPSVELASMPDLVVVPGLGISTRGPAASVLLVTRRPLAEVRSVALDPDSRTSNALVQVLFAGAWGTRPGFALGTADLEENLRRHDAAVRIGDKALFGSLPAGTAAVDLGEEWTRWTGLPFVFAVWAARAEVLDRELYELLHASRRQGTKVLDLIAEDYTWNGARDPGKSLEYLSRRISYRLGAAEVEAMRRFFSEAVTHGVVERAPRIRLASFGRVACDEVAESRGPS